MFERVARLAGECEQRVIGYRRDFHKHAETGWTEFRTASLIARELADLGFEVRTGEQVLEANARMGVPPAAFLEACWQRAKHHGGDPEYLDLMRGGLTGVVGVLKGGEGRSVGLRFDIDALDLAESTSETHRPVQEGFASIHHGAAHACGHDGHAAIGLGVARVIGALRDSIAGTVRLIFQPAEEGVRGAKAMVTAGVVDGLDYLLALHLYSRWALGELDPGRSGFLATSKFDAILTGAPAHAGVRPHEGRNALLAAATAVLNLQAIARHGDGATRVNVGRLTAGSGRNVIPERAHLVIETRGATTGLDQYVSEQAYQILEAAAKMHGCSLELQAMGGAQSGQSDGALAELVWRVAQQLEGLALRPPEPCGGSEDFTWMMERVQSQGGLATNIGLGADLGGWAGHTADFDFDERALGIAVKLLSAATLELLAGGEGA